MLSFVTAHASLLETWCLSTHSPRNESAYRQNAIAKMTNTDTTSVSKHNHISIILTFWPFFPLIHIQVHLGPNRVDSTKLPVCAGSRTPQDRRHPGCHHCHLHCHFCSLSSGGRLQICHPASYGEWKRPMFSGSFPLPVLSNLLRAHKPQHPPRPSFLLLSLQRRSPRASQISLLSLLGSKGAPGIASTDFSQGPCRCLAVVLCRC